MHASPFCRLEMSHTRDFFIPNKNKTAHFLPMNTEGSDSEKLHERVDSFVVCFSVESFSRLHDRGRGLLISVLTLVRVAHTVG